MNRATRATVSTFGVVAGLAGLEHGVGEILQGNRPPDGLVIASWPDSAAFRLLGGEPAFTIVPNLLATGLLTIAVSLAFMAWATLCVGRQHGGLVLMLWSAALFPVGGGFGPPLLGFVLGAAASGTGARFGEYCAHLPPEPRRFLAWLWPRLYSASLAAWLLVFPGTVVVAGVYPLDDSDPVVSALVAALILVALGLLLLTILAGLAGDFHRYPRRGSVQPGLADLRRAASQERTRHV